MPPESRGQSVLVVTHSKSTPNLTLAQSRDSGVPSLQDLAPSTAKKIDPAFNAAHLATEDSHTDSTARQQDTQHDEDASSSSDEDSDTAPVITSPKSATTRPPFMHHSRSHTYLGPAAFAPPFYNRPPTPLPPSPSLTSLLRPNFTQISRPTTPDPSSDEASGTPFERFASHSHSSANLTDSVHGLPRSADGTQTPLTAAAATTLTSSFRTAKPIPRASPKVPTYEYYGFTLYLTSGVVFLFYLLWSLMPSPLLHQLGMHYYPNRWWSLAIPAWLVVLVIWIYVALAGYNTGHLTLSMDRVECLVDEAALVAVLDDESDDVTDHGKMPSRRHGTIKGRIRHRKGDKADMTGLDVHAATVDEYALPQDWAAMWSEGTDAVMDVPIGGVCQVLYGSLEYESTDE